MGRPAVSYLTVWLLLHFLSCVLIVNAFPKGEIIRAKRDLDFDKEEVGDALYENEPSSKSIKSLGDSKESLHKRDANEDENTKEDENPEGDDAGDVSPQSKSETSKHEAGSQTTDSNSKENSDANQNHEIDKENSENKTTEKDVSNVVDNKEASRETKEKDENLEKGNQIKGHDFVQNTEKEKEGDKSEKSGKTRQNVEGKPGDQSNEQNKLLKYGMESNIDHPMINGDVIKKYSAAQDTSNGEILGIADKRDDITTTKDFTKDTSNKNIKHDQISSNSDSINKDNEQLTKRSDVSDRLFKRDDKDEKETHDIQEGGAPSHFQVDDKSSDLEINANSAGVKVKAKPASLQVVSRPGAHGPAPPMMPFVPPPVPVLHHHPHHYYHHRHHHHHRHHRPHYFIYPVQNDFFPMRHWHEEPHHWHGMIHHWHEEEPHYFFPYNHHFFDEPHWGHGWEDGYHLYGRGFYNGGPDNHLYERSTVETARDPRFSAPTALDGFNSGIALPDMDNRFMMVSHIPMHNLNNNDQDIQGMEDQMRASPIAPVPSYGGAAPMPEMEHEREPEEGYAKFSVPRIPAPLEPSRMRRRFEEGNDATVEEERDDFPEHEETPARLPEPHLHRR